MNGQRHPSLSRPRAAVVILALACVLAASACSLLPKSPSPSTPQVAASAPKSQAVRVASSTLVTKPGTSEPKVVLGLYEDFLCPVCGRFEEKFGATVNELISNGSVAADYYPVAILDSSRNQNYSSRAGGAAYCVAESDTAPDMQMFRRFHAALFAKQPDETGSTFPTNDQLAETASGLDATGDALECIKGGRYSGASAGLAEATKVDSTPTIRINGEDYTLSTPDALVTKVKELLG